MTCYAFFDREGKGLETMEEHIEKGLEVIDFYIKRNYHKKLAKCLGVDNKVGKITLETSYVLHDSAKGLEYYQDKKTFRGHEFYSAYIAYNSIDTITGDEKKDNEIKKTIACAIALHHHTMVNRFKPITSSPKLEMCEEGIEVIQKYSPIDVNIPSEIPSDVIHSITELFKDSDRIFRGVYLILVPLMVADNVSAILNRGNNNENLGVLGREVIEIYNIYKKYLGDNYAIHNNFRI
ncbi:CRISPR-associated HD domain protein [Methanocaldococcus sp. FS406-22]|uniref:CRISPR-associated endonuclease Cas3'' n=1 Tax=Methanocaldococcus sp. (strain FS406-22) TaxID=644281 RepID=UPI0001BF2F98|nr:CRISPR-associated endonuclease Cas3'' [Methanocaldococcus sp. FS406-22]ADC69855.1 CRISPR-associated HD domain protein [Methanocaldococcus sp. FS406-22]